LLKATACAITFLSGTPETWASSPRTVNAFDDLIDVAEKTAKRPYAKPIDPLPPPFAQLDYDLYRRLRPRGERTIWLDSDRSYGVLPLPRGYIFPDNVALTYNTNGGRHRLKDASRYYDFVDFQETTAKDRAGIGISGWRLLRQTASRPTQEVAVFQGGAYFRAVAENLFYGISARGLSLNTGGAEEFPSFCRFEVFPPASVGAGATVLALLDSQSVTGAYRFDIAYGDATVMDTTAVLFPRVKLSEVGIAPMSSMYARGGDDGSAADGRHEVHDSDGLCLANGEGEQIWRPLRNPRATQISAFHQTSLKGFGLQQRAREAAAYNDSEAHYDKRPSLWVEPQGDWGAGHLMLLEFPTTNEYSDNVVAFWKPDAPLSAGARHDFRYRLTWDARGARSGGGVINTALHAGTFAIDFDHPLAKGDTAHVSASAGQTTNIRFESQQADRTRLSFDLIPGDAALIELRANLQNADRRTTSETWVYQWTRV
jgi:glucans biosynthesis protein